MRAQETLVYLPTCQRTDSSSTALPAACLHADLSLVMLKVSCFNLLATADRAPHLPLTAMLRHRFQRGDDTRDRNRGGMHCEVRYRRKHGYSRKK